MPVVIKQVLPVCLSSTEIVDKTTCCQTLLLCSACLNNLTRIEATAVYSLMSHEAPGKLKVAADRRGPGAAIFLFVSIQLYNYSMRIPIIDGTN